MRETPRTIVGLLALLLLVSFSAAAMAAPPCCETRWLFRSFAAFGTSQGSNTTGVFRTAGGELGDYKFHFNDGFGLGLEAERLFAAPGKWQDAKWGWKLGLTRTDLDTIWTFDSPQRSIRDDDRIPVLALSTGINYHLHRGTWDFFAGPEIGFAHFGDGTYADGTLKPGTFPAAFEDKFFYGANLGVDALLGGCWGFTGGVDYMKSSTKADFLDVDVDPLILRLGLVYHF